MTRRFLIIYSADGDTGRRYIHDTDDIEQAKADFVHRYRPLGSVVLIEHVLALPAFGTGQLVEADGKQGAVSCMEVDGDVTVQFGADMRRFTPREQIEGVLAPAGATHSRNEESQS